MKIAVLMASAGSRLGGLETIALEFAAGLTTRGHDVTLVTGVGPGAPLQPDLQAGDLAYRIMTAPMLGQSSAPARLIAKMQGIHPSIVEAKSFWAKARRSEQVMDALRGSEVISAHFEVEAVYASNELHIPLAYYYAGPIDPRRLARAKPTRMVAISRMVADYHASLAAELMLPPVDGVVMPGVREECIASDVAPGVHDEPPEVIFTGRLDAVPQKRAEKLVEWWPRVLDAVPGAKLTLVGGGSALPQLRREVARSGLSASISLPGPLPHSQMFERLRRAGLYVFPSSLETFGIAPLEALAAGLPVVASDIAALRESLGSVAVLLPPEDDAVWIKTLVRMLSNTQKRLDLAALGPAWARQFTWARQTEAYEAQLQLAVHGVK